MSSALKPALPAGAAQASPGKVVASVAASQPTTGARPPALVGQNLTHHQPSAAHAAQSLAHIPMSPVSQNMAQMAQNMSHHGNLSHVGQNNGAPALGPSNGAPQPSKAATSAPLSLVQDKTPAGASQPLALTRPTDKKDEAEATSTQPNGTVDSSGLSAAPVDPPVSLDDDKVKSEASVCPAKSPAKPVEGGVGKPTESGPSKAVERSPAKPSEKAPVASQAKPDSSTPSPDNQLQVNKLGSSTDIADKTSPAKPQDSKETSQSASTAPATTASPSEPKLPDESASAKASNNQEPTTTQNASKPDSATVESEIKNTAKADTVEKKDTKPEAIKPAEAKRVNPETPTVAKAEEQKLPIKKEEQKSPPKKEEPKKEAPKLAEATPPPKKPEPKIPATKSTLKLATVTPSARKRRFESKSPAKVPDGPSPAKKPVEGETPSTPDSRISKRNRTKVQPYQSPTPELTMVTKLSASAGRSTPTKPTDDKLIVFYKNEYLAVRNAEGGFYVCQTMQNVYRSSRKIKIRWLSQDKSIDPAGETYKPDFYDITDMECVLTTLSMTRASAGGGAQVLSAAEAARARSILERALSAEQSGGPNLQLTEEHPDGLDLSLYTDESQLEKKKKDSRKRKSSKSSPEKSSEVAVVQKEDEAQPSPSKRAKTTPKKSPKSAPKVTKTTPKAPNNNNKRKSAPGSTTPIVANKTALVPSKPATAKSPAKKAKPTPTKKSPAKPAAAKAEPPAKVAPPAKATPPPAKSKTPRKSDRDSKIAQLAATPSTSTGKTTRTPRKPPSKKRRTSANNFILR